MVESLLTIIKYYGKDISLNHDNIMTINERTIISITEVEKYSVKTHPFKDKEGSVLDDIDIINEQSQQVFVIVLINTVIIFYFLVVIHKNY